MIQTIWSRQFWSRDQDGTISHRSCFLFYRFVGAVMPPDDLEKLFEQGYDHTEEFLQSEKFKKFLADLNVPDPTIEDGATEVPQENHA